MANGQLIRLIRALVADEKLEPGTALHAIAWKVAREGYGELTSGQQYVFKQHGPQPPSCRRDSACPGNRPPEHQLLDYPRKWAFSHDPSQSAPA
jgi:hypothetical protein